MPLSTPIPPADPSESKVIQKTTNQPGKVKPVAKQTISNPDQKSTGDKVDLIHLSDYQDGLATYLYRNCLKAIGNITGEYSCENQLKTFTTENGAWNLNTVSGKNKNGTRDYGLCQLNGGNAVYRKFINSPDFKDPYKQLDYCLEIWIDAKKRGSMPWFGHQMYDYLYSSKQMANRLRARGYVKIVS